MHTHLTSRSKFLRVPKGKSSRRVRLGGILRALRKHRPYRYRRHDRGMSIAADTAFIYIGTAEKGR